MYLATVIDLYSRRLLGAATGLHPDAELACEAIRMAVAARGGADRIAGVTFHTDRGSTYTSGAFTALCRGLGIRQSMGRAGSCFDNAAAEAFFSSLEWEVLSRNDFDTTSRARMVVIDWCYGFYNHDDDTAPRTGSHRSTRRTPPSPETRQGTLHDLGGTTRIVARRTSSGVKKESPVCAVALPGRAGHRGRRPVLPWRWTR